MHLEVLEAKRAKKKHERKHNTRWCFSTIRARKHYGKESTIAQTGLMQGVKGIRFFARAKILDFLSANLVDLLGSLQAF